MEEFIEKPSVDLFVKIFNNHKTIMFDYLYDSDHVDMLQIEETLRVLIMESIEHYLGFISQHLGIDGISKIKEEMRKKIIEQIDTYKGEK